MVGVLVGNSIVRPLRTHAVGIVGVRPFLQRRKNLTRLGIDNIAFAVCDFTAIIIAVVLALNRQRNAGGCVTACGGIVPGHAAVAAYLPLVGKTCAMGFHSKGSRIADFAHGVFRLGYYGQFILANLARFGIGNISCTVGDLAAVQVAGIVFAHVYIHAVGAITACGLRYCSENKSASDLAMFNVALYSDP